MAQPDYARCPSRSSTCPAPSYCQENCRHAPSGWLADHVSNASPGEIVEETRLEDNIRIDQGCHLPLRVDCHTLDEDRARHMGPCRAFASAAHRRTLNGTACCGCHRDPWADSGVEQADAG